MSYLWNFSSGNIILDQILPVLFLHVELSNFFVKQNNLLIQGEKFSRVPLKEMGLFTLSECECDVFCQIRFE